MNKLLSIGGNNFIVLSLTLVFIFCASLAFSQLSITGQQHVCQNESEIYELQGAVAGVIYSWNITSGTGTINQINNDQVVIQWTAFGSSTIQVSDGTNLITRIVNVYKTNKPTIIYDNEVGCQQVHSEVPFQSNEIIDDNNECINVCEGSTVQYVSHGTLVSGQNLSEFKWEVVGGEIVSVDGVTQAAGTVVAISGTLYFPNPNGLYSSIEVRWGNVGLGKLTVTETTPYIFPSTTNPTNCSPKSTSLCFDIIEKPQANFLVDNQQILPDKCYEVCLNQQLNFSDISTASSNSTILFWQWDFGDGSPVSHQQNPMHSYTSSGDYKVSLLITNRCNCTSEYNVQICVDELPAPNLQCPSVVCENENAVYTLDAICSNYHWNISGGSISSPNGQEIEVNWNNVGIDGYGYLSIDGQYCNDVCPAVSSYKIPVILQSGTVQGPTSTCINKVYKFELPAWPATNYEWSITNNSSNASFATISSREYFVEIEAGTSGGSFDLVCNYQNTITKNQCGGAATIHVDVLEQPTIITNAKHCITSAIQCSLTNGSTPLVLTANVEWRITDPFGGYQSFTSNTNPFTFPANIYSVAGKYLISAQSLNSEFCDPEFVKIEIVDKPQTPANIYGEDMVCLNTPYTYTTDITDNTIVHWNLTGANSALTSEGNIRTVIWGTSSQKSLTIYRESEELAGCVSQTFSKTINNIFITGNITSSTITANSTYEDVTDNFSLSLNNGIVPEVIEWIILPSSAGNVSSGQGAANCSITWHHLQAPLNNVEIRCNITKCGYPYTATKIVNIDKSAEIISLTASPSSVCSGTASSFSVVCSGAPVSEYIIDFGDGNSQNLPQANPTSTFSFNHTFKNTGTTSIVYPVNVKVRSYNNNLITSTQVINVTVYPNPNVSLSPANTVIPTSSFPVLLSVASTASAGNTFDWKFKAENSTNTLNIGTNVNTYTVNSIPPIGASTSFGDYWCLVSNTFNLSNNTTLTCASKTNDASVRAPYLPPNCSGVPPVGISGFPLSYSTLNCGSNIQINCNTAGSTGTSGNIVSFNWSVNPNGNHTESGTPTEDQSPVYDFNTAGIYQIKLSVDYVDATNSNSTCTYQKQCEVNVPMVVDIDWGLSCNSNGNGYILKLYDKSTFIPAFPVVSRYWEIRSGTTLITTINSNSSTIQTYNVPSQYNGTTLNITLVTSNSQQGSACSKTESIDIPNLPIADFSMITTYPANPSTPYKSCEGREVAFVNNSSPMADIHTHIWLFDVSPSVQSNMVNTSFTYDINSTNYTFGPSLTVTDKHGCWDTKAKQIQVFKNGLTRIPFSSEYLPTSQTVCPNLIINPAIYPQYNYTGTGSLSYKWYKGTDYLPNVQTPNLAYAYEGSGAYWVQISDAYACYLNLNPSPVLISENASPTANIEGKTNVCDNNNVLVYRVKTGMSSSANLSYTWVLNGTTLTASTKEIQIYPASLNMGNNQLMVTVSDLSTGGCSTSSSPFIIELHQSPQNLVISPPVPVDCSAYELALTGSASSSSTPLTYNWSTGQSGQSISVFNGGAYRMWVLDKYGCKNHIDRAIQYPPDFYFWRFPTGCYSFCEEDMPKTVWPATWTYGNANLLFSDWAWLHNGANVAINGPSFGTCTWGSNPGTAPYSIPCRLWIDNAFANPNTGIVEGEGSGEYYWMLNNGLCAQDSKIMNINIEECCELDVQIIELRCLQSSPNGNLYSFNISIDNVPCPGAFNLSVVDNSGWPLLINTSSLNLTSLNTGQNTVAGSFTAQPNSTDIKFMLHLLCEDCMGESTFEALPACTGPRLAHSDSLQNETTLNGSLKVFPNPANNVLNIAYSFTDQKNTSPEDKVLIIVDCYGSKIKEIKLEKSTGEVKLNTADLVQGLYFVGMIQGKTRLRAEIFIINR